MLAACRERGLTVETADAIGSLRALADNSVAVVSAFHLVEHLPFDAVQELVKQSLRVLQPGGLLIMETPNPENPMVGACRFYLDPSHERPIPPNLLGFLAEYGGFARHKVARLQEDPALHTAPIRLINVIDGASPDYGIVAQKAAPAEVLERFDPAFHRQFGIGVEELAQRFEQNQQANLAELKSTLSERLERAAGEFSARLEAQARAFSERLERQVAELTGRLDRYGEDLTLVDKHWQHHAAETSASSARTDAVLAEVQALIAQADARIAKLNTDLAKTDLLQVQYDAKLAEMNLRMTESHTQVAADHARHEEERKALLNELSATQAQLMAMFDSTSWRVTAPLRWAGRVIRRRK
jgi:hypothetical protein